MALAVFLLSFSLGQIAVALEYGGWTWLLTWPALASLGLSVAYFAHRPGALGKRLSGTIAVWAWPLFLPYFAFAWLLWRTHRIITREDAWNEVAPGLFLGRRAEPRELPDVPVVVDLTAEFVAPPAIRQLSGYRCLPTLDATAPDDERFLMLVNALASTPRLFIHCAQGHGRSATLAAALLIRRGLAASPGQAEEQLKKKRPAVALKRVQRALLERLQDRLLSA